MARRPIHDRHQIQKAALHRDVGDVGAPDLIGPVDRQPLEKIGINPVSGMGVASSWRLVNRLQAHQTHQASHSMTTNTHAVAPQLADHLTRYVKRIFKKQLVDTTH